MPPLYKTTIVIWAPNIDDLEVKMKEDRPFHVAKLETEMVVDPVLDPDWNPDVEFAEGDFHCLDDDERKTS